MTSAIDVNVAFVSMVESRLSESVSGDAKLVSATPTSAAFGDTAAVFRIGPSLLRLTRDRRQEFVALASQSEPETFLKFDDVDIATGSRSVDEVLAKRESEPISVSASAGESEFCRSLRRFLRRSGAADAGAR